MRNRDARFATILLVLGLVLPLGCMGPWQDEWNLAPTEVHVSESIYTDTVWNKETRYVLQDLVYVESGAELRIEAGTTIVGEEATALIVTRDATIHAKGTAAEPITFTSNRAAGERVPGDWGGLVLLGKAPTNDEGFNFIEGVEDDPRVFYGGNDEYDNCGLLEYVRVQFAGYEIYQDNEINGLTLGGCGRSTIMRNIQVHATVDDGIEFFGGTANLFNAVISSPGDDGLDWDRGWQGNVQFLIVTQKDSTEVGDNGFEADNWEEDHDATPRSMPSIYNVTMVGSGNPDAGNRGMTIRRGTGAKIRNLIMQGFPKESVDLRDVETVALLDDGEGTGDLSFDYMMVYDVGEGGNSWFSDEPVDPKDEDDDDGGYVEEDYFTSRENISFGANPKLPAEAYDDVNPDFVPALDSPAMEGTSPPQGEIWDDAADFIGAVRPGDTNPWYAGWTEFPEN